MQETYQGNSFIDTIFITAIVILPKIIIKKFFPLILPCCTQLYQNQSMNGELLEKSSRRSKKKKNEIQIYIKRNWILNDITITN